MKDAIALLFNDIHIDKDNIDEFEKNWNEALDICQKRGIYDIVVGGDMFVSRSSQTLPVLLSVQKALLKGTELGINITLAEGNHDLVNPESIEGYNHLYSQIDGVEVIDSHKIMYWEGCDFALVVMSYFPEKGSFIERLAKAYCEVFSQFLDFNEKNIILYIHEGVHGALGDFEIEDEVPQDVFKWFRAVLCGHYHNRAKIKGTRIEYIGSSRQHNFGEDEEKGYTVLYSDGSYEFVKNQVNIRYETIELDDSNVSEFKLNPKPGYRYKVKIKCSASTAESIDRQSFFDMGFVKVEIITNEPMSMESMQSEIQEKYDRQGIKQEYQCYCDDNLIDSTLGIKYLEE